MAARPTVGALGLLSALAPMAVVPKGTTELGGGAAAAAESGAPGPAASASAASGSTAARHRRRVAFTRCTR